MSKSDGSYQPFKPESKQHDSFTGIFSRTVAGMFAGTRAVAAPPPPPTTTTPNPEPELPTTTTPLLPRQ